MATEDLILVDDRMRRVIASMPVMLDAFDGEGRLLFWNSACERLTGYSAQEMVGNPGALAWLYPDPAHRADVLRTLERTHGDFSGLEFELTCKDGTRRTIAWTNLSNQCPIPGWASWAVGVDVTSRKEAEHQLRQREEQLRTVVSHTPVVLFAIDHEGIFRLSEGLGLAGLGLKPGEVVGQSVFEIYRESPQVPEHVRRALAGESFQTVTEVGSSLFQTWYEPILGGEGRVTGVIGTAFDITERRRDDQVREGLRRLTQASVGVLTLRELGEVLAESSRELFHHDAFSFDLIDEAQAGRETVLAEDTPPGGSAPVRVVSPTRRLSASQEVLLLGEPLLQNRDSNTRPPDATAWGFAERVSRSLMDAPIRRSGRCVGMLSVQSYAAGRYRQEDLQLLQIMADQCAAALWRVQTDEALRENERTLRALVAGTSSVAGTDFFRVLARELAGALKVRYALIGELVGPDPSRVRILSLWAGDGLVQDPPDYALAGTPCAEVAGRQLCAFPDRVAELFPQDAMLREMGARSYLGAPLFGSHGQALGLLAVIDDQPMAHLESRRSILSIFAARAGVELERIRGEQEVRDLNRRLERLVEERTAELRLTNQELESFCYSVSHDLRAPVRNISGFLTLLKKQLGGAVPDPASHYLQTLTDEARRMGQLIDDLLVLSRTGRAKLEATALDMALLVTEVVDGLQLETAGRRIEWRIGPLPRARGDRRLVRQVLANLLGNAVKFTRPRDPAVVEVGSMAEPDREGEAVFFVRDNGVGFDPRYGPKLFGAFQRLHSVREFEGTGVGLANVQRIVLRHGGRVWAEGRPGLGATFFFSLPVPVPGGKGGQ